ncbi:hypothetical protein [Streptomyces sp. TRM68367]|uniref:hypothetical protein n=1 Tax=Streptomyces sp. TRM68367 TaxID=2758415 RepID=UPI00165ACF7F|nr:hypothetical protein [Streptomyces sp. TRM68367]MBC9727529.1 hypothetical protein [Streptomyces sp. TRM68367]
MLHARIARAYAKTGQRTKCARVLNAAYDAPTQGPHEDDPAWSYWLSTGELENLAGTCALDLGDPARTLRHFDARTATTATTPSTSPAAEARLAQDDIEHACASASEAVTLLDGVAAARSSSTLSGSCDKLTPYRDTPPARDFLASLAG